MCDVVSGREWLLLVAALGVSCASPHVRPVGPADASPMCWGPISDFGPSRPCASTETSSVLAEEVAAWTRIRRRRLSLTDGCESYEGMYEQAGIGERLAWVRIARCSTGEDVFRWLDADGRAGPCPLADSSLSLGDRVWATVWRDMVTSVVLVRGHTVVEVRVAGEPISVLDLAQGIDERLLDSEECAQGDSDDENDQDGGER